MYQTIQRVNRIYATKDTRFGTIYKIKKDYPYKVNLEKAGKSWDKNLTETQRQSVIENGYYLKDKYDKLGNAPEHCLIDNENKMTLEQIDLDYYINMANERIARYIGGDKKIMATKKTEESQTTVTLNEPTDNISKLWFKIRKLTAFFNQEAPKFVKDGYNSGQKYEYVKASQYKNALRKGLLECGLGIKVNLIDFTKIDLANSTSSMTTIMFRGMVILIDIETGESTAYNCLALGADSLDKQASKAETLLIKDFIKSNFLIDDNQEDPEEDVKPIVTAPKTSTTPVAPTKPLNAGEREVIKEKIVEQQASSSNIPESTIKYAIDLVTKIREKSGNPKEGTKMLESIVAKNEKGEYTIDPLDLKRKINTLEDRADVLGLQI